MIVNIGGIANITDLPPTGAVNGFDTGPGNALLDLWCARNRGDPFDAGGAWAATGKVNDALLTALLAEPFFTAKPPKSTHRDKFNLSWLEERLVAAEWKGEADSYDDRITVWSERTPVLLSTGCEYRRCSNTFDLVRTTKEAELSVNTKSRWKSM